MLVLVDAWLPAKIPDAVVFLVAVDMFEVVFHGLWRQEGIGHDHVNIANRHSGAAIEMNTKSVVPPLRPSDLHVAKHVGLDAPVVGHRKQKLEIEIENLLPNLGRPLDRGCVGSTIHQLSFREARLSLNRGRASLFYLTPRSTSTEILESRLTRTSAQLY